MCSVWATHPIIIHLIIGASRRCERHFYYRGLAKRAAAVGSAELNNGIGRFESRELLATKEHLFGQIYVEEVYYINIVMGLLYSSRSGLGEDQELPQIGISSAASRIQLKQCGEGE